MQLTTGPMKDAGNICSSGLNCPLSLPVLVVLRLVEIMKEQLRSESHISVRVRRRVVQLLSIGSHFDSDIVEHYEYTTLLMVKM